MVKPALLVAVHGSHLAGNMRRQSVAAVRSDAAIGDAGTCRGTCEQSPVAIVLGGCVGRNSRSAEPSRVGETLSDKGAKREDDDDGRLSEGGSFKVAELGKFEGGEDDS